MLLVVGWDGACFELVNRFRAGGRMPVLDSLLLRGRAWRVRSTLPAVTFPAWTSFLTGAHPDHHGVTDFTIPRPGSYGVRFVNATHRRLPTVLAVMAGAGKRVGMYGIPATYPPEGRGVFEICGFDTPLGATAGDRATHPRSLAGELRRRHGRLGIEGIAQSRIDAGWHRATHAQLLDDIALRTRIALEMLGEHALDVFVVHFMESDTVSHHFWQFDDAASPRHRAGPQGVLADVYAALDRSLGELLAAAGPEADVLLLSDHGSAGASDRIVFWNRWLADAGLLAFHASERESPAVRLKRQALALLPARWQARAFAAAGFLADRVESGARFANIDWRRTEVYSDEVPYFPSLRLNLAGREPKGIVAAAAKEACIAEVSEKLLAARDPFDGGCVVERVRRREELFDGPFADRYPDLILELRRPGGYAYSAASSRGGMERSWMRGLREDETSGAKGSSTGGVHSAYGMAVLSGPVSGGPAAAPAANTGGSCAEADGLPECSLADLGVTALALAGLAPSAQMQGRSVVAPGAPAPAAGGLGEVAREAVHAIGLPAPIDGSDAPAAGEYTDDEEREVAERLRALGYLP